MKGTEKMDPAIILAGGGIRVSYQAGVLLALYEGGLSFSFGDGTSGGTFNLAMLLSGLSPVEMCRRWRDMKALHFSSIMPVKEYLRPFKMEAMGSAEGIINKVFPGLGVDLNKINASKMSGSFNVCNYTKKTIEAIPHSKVTQDHLVAGVSLPIFMPPVRVNDQLYLDAAWIKDANLMEAVKQGHEDLWLIWCIGNTPDYIDSMFHQYVHMIELSANGGLFEEFDRINELNERIKKGDSPYGQKNPIRLHVIKPEYPLPLDPELFSGHIDFATLIDMGYDDTMRYLAAQKPEGVSMTPDATQMKSQKEGLFFRFEFSGKLENKSGEVFDFTWNGAVHCNDIDSFIENPKHSARLTGRITSKIFSEETPGYNGVYNVYFSENDKNMKIIEYRMMFRRNGEDYLLIGRQEIFDDPGFDFLSDICTMKATLHRGTDEAAPIEAKGELKMSIAELTKTVAGMTVFGQDLADKINIIRRFKNFIFGDAEESIKN